MSMIYGVCGYHNIPTDIKITLAGCYAAKRGDNQIALAADDRSDISQSDDKGVVCVVDGNIYNKEELTSEFNLPGISKASLPAEIILKAYMHKGTSSFKYLNGSIVFAIWDGNKNQLVLTRDSSGIKSLFYSRTPNGFLFSSNLTRLAKSGLLNKEIGTSGLLEYMACGYISAPYTIYRNISALCPGEYLILKNGEVKTDTFYHLEPPNWDFQGVDGFTESELAEKLENLLLKAVKLRICEGSKIAAYLSGGLDSSLLCSVLKTHVEKEVVAFTMGFRDSRNDETSYARAVAKHLNIEHESYYLEEHEFFDALELLPEIYGQPFADISAIPTNVITEKVSHHHNAVLASDGPDFLFGNYDLRQLYYYYKLVPHKLRQIISKMLEAYTKAIQRDWVSPNWDAPELLRQNEFFWVYPRMFKGQDLEELLNEPVYPQSFWVYRFLETRKDIPLAERLRLAQYLCYGVSSVLYKSRCSHDFYHVDLLCPYYDREFIEFVQYLPTRYKFRRLYGKYLQRKLLYEYVPRQLLDRPKRGFVMDFVEFGAKPIRSLANKYLNRRRLDEMGLVNTDFALECIENYFKGDHNMGPKLWTLLIFEMWREKYY